MPRDMKRLRTRLMSLVVALAAAAHPVGAQSLVEVDGRQCAAAGSDLLASLSEQLPGCDRYCTVDKEAVPGYETYPGLVFACADRRGVIVVDENDDDSGLTLGVLGAAAALGLLLSVAGTPTGGSTNNSTLPR